MSVVQDGKSTRIISVVAAAGGTNVVAHSFCRRIVVTENFASADGATTDTGQVEPLGADEIIVPKGVPVIFTYAGGSNGQYTPGQIVGSVRVLDVEGPVNYQQVENQLI